jgi:drug/metabolite transporter (DMT)-like permease
MPTFRRRQPSVSQMTGPAARGDVTRGQLAGTLAPASRGIESGLRHKDNRTPLDTHLILFSIVILSLYNVLLKRFSQKLLLLFWVSLLSYVGFAIIYLFQSFILEHNPHPIRELIFEYTFEDVPLYLIIAVSFLGSTIISEKLLDGYDLSLVIPISQFGVLLASAGYIALGDPFQWSLALGIAAVCLGTFILSLSATAKPLSLSVFAEFKNIPGNLWALVGLQALCFTVSAVVSYLGTKETARTDALMDGMRRLHLGPIAFHGAFYFNLGQQLYSISLFLIYILVQEKYRLEIFSPLTTSAKYLSLVVLAYIAAEYAYFIAFMITTDTTILLVLDNLSIPITLLLSFFLLKEQIGHMKIIGSSLIMLGGLAAAL